MLPLVETREATGSSPFFLVSRRHLLGLEITGAFPHSHAQLIYAFSSWFLEDEFRECF